MKSLASMMCLSFWISSPKIVVFPKAYELFKDKIIKDTPLRFFGKVSLKNKDSGNGNDNADAQEKKVRDDGTEAKSYGNKAIILDEIKSI